MIKKLMTKEDVDKVLKDIKREAYKVRKRFTLLNGCSLLKPSNNDLKIMKINYGGVTLTYGVAKRCTLVQDVSNKTGNFILCSRETRDSLVVKGEIKDTVSLELVSDNLLEAYRNNSGFTKVSADMLCRLMDKMQIRELGYFLDKYRLTVLFYDCIVSQLSSLSRSRELYFTKVSEDGILSYYAVDTSKSTIKSVDNLVAASNSLNLVTAGEYRRVSISKSISVDSVVKYLFNSRRDIKDTSNIIKELSSKSGDDFINYLAGLDGIEMFVKLIELKTLIPEIED